MAARRHRAKAAPRPPEGIVGDDRKRRVVGLVRQARKTEGVNQVVDECFKRYPQGPATNVQKGKVPSQYQSLARDVAKYVVSPPVAVRRIERYDGMRRESTA